MSFCVVWVFVKIGDLSSNSSYPMIKMYSLFECRNNGNIKGISSFVESSYDERSNQVLLVTNYFYDLPEETKESIYLYEYNLILSKEVEIIQLHRKRSIVYEMKNKGIILKNFYLKEKGITIFTHCWS